MALPFIPDLIDKLDENIPDMVYDLEFFIARLNQAGISAEADDIVACGGALRSASGILEDFKEHFLTTVGGDYNWCRNVRECMYWINRFAGGGAPAEVDMDTILTAMTTASFEQLTSFMGITQAYKIAVWDAPFNEEYYAALARGFRQWGM